MIRIEISEDFREVMRSYFEKGDFEYVAERFMGFLDDKNNQFLINQYSKSKEFETLLNALDYGLGRNDKECLARLADVLKKRADTISNYEQLHDYLMDN